MKNDNLKVPDICNLTKEDIQRIEDTHNRLVILCKEYFKDVSNLFLVDELKRKFLAELNNYVEEFSKIKSFKSGSHVYLEDQRKRLKAEAIDYMVNNDKFKRTVAEVMVYSSLYYKERFDLLERLKALFIKYELKYDYFNRVLDSMIQSISVGGKEYNHSKHS